MVFRVLLAKEMGLIVVFCFVQMYFVLFAIRRSNTTNNAIFRHPYRRNGPRRRAALVAFFYFELQGMLFMLSKEYPRAQVIERSS